MGEDAPTQPPARERSDGKIGAATLMGMVREDRKEDSKERQRTVDALTGANASLERTNTRNMRIIIALIVLAGGLGGLNIVQKYNAQTGETVTEITQP